MGTNANGGLRHGRAVDGRGARAQHDRAASSAPLRAHGDEAPRLMLGRYELITELASGGMGVVYLGRLQGVGGFERLFAIKVLHAHLAHRPQIVAMLLNEARLAAQIQHPNVVSTVDAQVSSAGQYYVVMEFVDGVTLCELLDHPRLDAVRRVRFGLRVLLDALAGLDAAHRLCSPVDGSALGIVHRDVAPTNILISLQGVGMIADFGIARATAAQSDCLPGLVKGTPCYMAPEQLGGDETLDARADVFSAGAVLWEVLTGEQLFYSPGGVNGVFSLVHSGEIPAPSSRNSRVPPALDAVCLRALERDPRRRYPSARELYADLERVGRERDLIAAPHEIAEALPVLFAEQLQRRRALVPPVEGSSSALVAIPGALRMPPALPTAAGAGASPLPTPSPSEPQATGGAAFEPPGPVSFVDALLGSAAAGELVAPGAASDPGPLHVPPVLGAPSLRVAALAASIVALIAALSWLARIERGERGQQGPAPSAAATARDGANAAHAAPLAATPSPDREPLPHDEPAAMRQPRSSGAQRPSSTAATVLSARIEAGAPNAQPDPTAPGPALPTDPYAAPVAPAAPDTRDEPALEANPYLMPR